MFHSQVNSQRHLVLGLAMAAAGLFAAAGCSNQPANQTASGPKAVAPTTGKKAETAKATNVSSKATDPAQVITLPKGTAISATMRETLASNKNHPGDSFAASLSKPVTVDGKVVLPKGARVTGRVVTVKKHEMKVTLASVVVRGKSYDLATNSVRPPDKKQPKKNEKDNAAASDKKDKGKKDITRLPVQTQLTFKLTKSVTVPARG